MLINFTNTKRTLRNHECNDEIGTFDNPNVWKASKNGFHFRIKNEDRFYLSIWITRKCYDEKMKRKTEQIYQYSSRWKDNISFSSLEETKEFAEKWLEYKLKSTSQ